MEIEKSQLTHAYCKYKSKYKINIITFCESIARIILFGFKKKKLGENVKNQLTGELQENWNDWSM